MPPPLSRVTDAVAVAVEALDAALRLLGRSVQEAVEGRREDDGVRFVGVKGRVDSLVGSRRGA